MLSRLRVWGMVACLLLTQSAAFLGHSHAGKRLPGHDQRPHFHIALLHDDSADGDAGDHNPAHDKDAVYVTGVDAVATERGITDFELKQSSIWQSSIIFELPVPYLNIVSRHRECLRPPDDPCPRYVRHLALLI